MTAVKKYFPQNSNYRKVPLEKGDVSLSWQGIITIYTHLWNIHTRHAFSNKITITFVLQGVILCQTCISRPNMLNDWYPLFRESSVSEKTLSRRSRRMRLFSNLFKSKVDAESKQSDLWNKNSPGNTAFPRYAGAVVISGNDQYFQLFVLTWVSIMCL